MATYSLVPSGKYAVCETPKLTARKIGGAFLKNQFALDSTDFASTPAQNGMLLVVDEFNKAVKLPTAITDYVYLHNSPVKDYEGKGKDTVAVNRGELLPAMYKLTEGDTIITNCVTVDAAVYADVAAIKAAISATVVYGICGTDGCINLVAAPGGTEVVVLKALEVTTLANGATAIKFVVTLA
jgi:hypothetical protein